MECNKLVKGCFDKSKSIGDKAKELCSHIVDKIKDVCSYVSDNTGHKPPKLGIENPSTANRGGYVFIS